jgi:hypothetical protein
VRVRNFFSKVNAVSAQNAPLNAVVILRVNMDEKPSSAAGEFRIITGNYVRSRRRSAFTVYRSVNSVVITGRLCRREA